jgi:hypothetical protein
MKAFVYRKDRRSELYAVINGVVSIWEDGNDLMVKTEAEVRAYDTKRYKLTIYENGTKAR